VVAVGFFCCRVWMQNFLSENGSWFQRKVAAVHFLLRPSWLRLVPVSEARGR